MKILRIVSYVSAATVLVVCVGLIYLRQTPIVGPSRWTWDDPFALYFAAKGLFCAVALILLYHIYAALAALKT